MTAPSDSADNGSTAEAPDSEPTELTLDRFYDVLEARERPVVTASEVARTLDVPQAASVSLLERLADEGHVESLDAEPDPVVWYPRDYRETQRRERVEVFPNRREVFVSQPTQFTRAQLSQFAHLEETNREGGYRYRVREEDVWQAPYDDLDGLRSTMRQALGGRHEALEEWVESQWARARKFRLVTHVDGYVVLEASSPDLLGNVAQQHLDESALRAAISDTEAWVAEDAVSTVKRTLYDAGYPVADERELEAGEPLEVELHPRLREYQQDWVDRFLDRRAGVLVGPPGSGKTVAALGVMAAVGGESLILVPGRELAGQWRTALLEQTTLGPDQVGEYHGGEKSIRPVTVATYRTAGMDRHRHLFDDREWGLIVYDEVHHIPSPIHRATADLQTRHRLGLSATPVREDDQEAEIFTLIGPPIGTDWEALFDAGFVAEPEVEIRYIPWPDDEIANEYTSAEGHERRQLAASNPAKAKEVAAILRAHPGQKALVFVEYLDQGDQLAEDLDVPFVSGRTPHAERSRLFEGFRAGDRDTLVVSRVGDEGLDLPSAEVAIAASGLGGSRRQGAQRAGRTMRPVGRARLYVLATRGTREEEFARRRMRHLAGKGIRVREEPPRHGSRFKASAIQPAGVAADSDASRHDRLERHPTPGSGNSLRGWTTIRSPWRVALNYAVIVIARHSPSLRLKNWLFRRLGMSVGRGAVWALESTPDVFWPERITVGEDALLGYDVTVLCHEFLQDEYRTGEVVIGDRAMIGAATVVLPGVRIGDDARVGANSVVSKDVPDGAHVAGVPATPIGSDGD